MIAIEMCHVLQAHLEQVLFLQPICIALSMCSQAAVLSVDALSRQINAASQVFVFDPQLVLCYHL